MNWQTFYYKTPGNNHTPYYHNWLPENLEDILPLTAEEKFDILMQDYTCKAKYQNFDTLVHNTSFKNASGILRAGFKPRPVLDNSVVSSPLTTLDGIPVPRSSPHHPIEDLEVVWYSPYAFEDIKDKNHCYKMEYVRTYGNVLFR